jgi:hypothetical protein
LVVRERRLRQPFERAGRHVLRHLAVAELDDVGRVAAGKRGVELRQVRAPTLILDVDVDVRVLRFEEPVGRATASGQPFCASFWSQTTIFVA